VGEKKRFLLRISPELWDELNRWAAQDFRSVNAQIEYVLRRAVDEQRRGKRVGAVPPSRESEERAE
jgi:hypothetical protein